MLIILPFLWKICRHHTHTHTHTHTRKGLVLLGAGDPWRKGVKSAGHNCFYWERAFQSLMALGEGRKVVGTGFYHRRVQCLWVSARVLLTITDHRSVAYILTIILIFGVLRKWSSSNSSNWILMSCQPQRVTSGQSNSGHKQIHISKFFSHIDISTLCQVNLQNQSLRKHKTYIRHKFSKS